MTPIKILTELRKIQEKHKNDVVSTFDIRISDMAKDSADAIDALIVQVKYLWGLLDDIDTVGDMVKNNDDAYRRMVEKIHPKRQLVAEAEPSYDMELLARYKILKKCILKNPHFSTDILKVKEEFKRSISTERKKDEPNKI